MPSALPRRAFLLRLPALALLPGALAACRTGDPAAPGTAPSMGAGRPSGIVVPPPDPSIARLDKPKAEWRRLLDADRYDVLFEHATEPAWSSPLNDEKRPGTFACAACHLPLFETAAKFDSGTGWPSFYAPLAGHLGTTVDRTLGMERVEYHCVRCGGHQGHVFDDAPTTPTGLRYCNNGLALLFFPTGEALPALRT